MRHLAIGDKVFAVSSDTPLTSFERRSSGSWNEVGLIGSARSEKVGRPLDFINISCKWLRDSAFDNVDDLRKMIDVPQQVSDGQGRNLGRWTIKSISEKRSAFINNGKAMVTNLDLGLQEYRGES
ncbi:phage tail protein [Vibrio rumoiensis]|uniref:Phage tail protein n=1 Tax=Vibrio rumoiensis TaxID=76258 RepID=A0ABW7J1T7_9VIBR